MTERPILFNDADVRAILLGAKTQMRRPVTARDPSWIMTYLGDDRLWPHEYVKPVRTKMRPMTCPFGVPGDRLWVRECWASENARESWKHVAYRADGVYGAHGGDGDGGRLFVRHGWLIDRMPSDAVGSCKSLGLFGGKWRPSIHMPRWASRLTLRITDVHVERVQDLAEADAIAEGTGIARIQDSLSPSRGPFVDAFANAWDAAYPGSWERNDWVWVITFEREQP